MPPDPAWPKCNQKDCEKPALFRFTWPGRDEETICPEHLPKLRSVAAAIGLPLQVRFLPEIEAQLDDEVHGTNSLRAHPEED